MTQYPAFKKLGAGAYKPGLEATLDLAARFGNPQDRLRTVHVAGTNGKGTTASLIAAALQAAGYKTGLYTSPHLTDFLERIRVDGRMIDGEAIADFMERYHAGRPAGDFRPSFFELTTVMALEYFAREGVDVAVVEVGLGGRLDSTNIVRPDLCVITNISMDHTQILGDTPAKIAAEKAGIIKEGVPVVVGEAANGEEGLAAVERYSPNLIITDVRMPRMDGIEMMNRLRAAGCRAHVIVLTAHSDFSYARSALQFGADDYLLKPFRDQELMAAIDKVRRKEQELTALTPQDTLPLAKGDKSKYVLQALEYIAGHYADQDISITTIAAHLGVSEGHLSHVFKKETSYTIISYLTQYRVHTAMKLLQDCRYKVYEVAEMVGYRDVAYFGSTFKKLVGVSPSEYQDRCR